MLILLLFILGTIAGSFMNVCIYRMPRSESIVFPGSHCPHCKTPIKWFDNLPVLSFILLRGKCRYCGSRISLKYPLVELLSGAIWTVVFLRFGISSLFFIYVYFLSALLVISFIDMATYEIPDSISLSGIALGLIVAAVYAPLTGQHEGYPRFLDSLIGVVAGGGSIYLLGFLGEFIFKKEAMGGGDVKLVAMMGAFLGWKAALLVFFLAPFFGCIGGLILKLRDGRDTIPYGPYLSMAAVVALFYGDVILNALLHSYL